MSEVSIFIIYFIFSFYFLQRNRIQVSSKTGMPVGVLGKGLTKSNLKDLDSKYEEEHGAPTRSLITVTSIRNKDETPEEKLERKKLVKEIRRVCI